MKNLVQNACLALTVLLVSSLPGCTTWRTKADKWNEKKGSHRPRLYSYRVKYLCSALHPLPTVFHWTDINVLNPSKKEIAAVTKKFIAAGKQKMPPPIPPKREEFELDPNQAITIDCDEIQSMLGKPLSTPLEGFVEIESKTELTVVGVYDKCVPQPRTDVFPYSVVTGEISLRGSTERQTIRLTGPVVVKKGEVRILPEWRRAIQTTEIESMDLRGMAGNQEVQLLESSELQSAGQITGMVDPESLEVRPPYKSYFDVNALVRIHQPDGSWRDLLIRDARVSATLDSIPPGPPHLPAAGEDAAPQRAFPVPVGVNRYCSQGESTPLYDPATGQVVGDISNHCHDPNPPPPSPPPPPKHVPVACGNASIDVEYVEPAMLWDKEKRRHEGKGHHPN